MRLKGEHLQRRWSVGEAKAKCNCANEKKNYFLSGASGLVFPGGRLKENWDLGKLGEKRRDRRGAGRGTNL